MGRGDRLSADDILFGASAQAPADLRPQPPEPEPRPQFICHRDGEQIPIFSVLGWWQEWAAGADPQEQRDCWEMLDDLAESGSTRFWGNGWVIEDAQAFAAEFSQIPEPQLS
jgi:hypothetical protein